MAGRQRMTKAERRAAAQEAMARAAAVKRRGQMISWSVAGVLAVGLVVAAFLVFSSASDGDETDATAAPSASATGKASFPPLPKGADPALGTKPTVTAGSGELTKLTVTPIIEGKGAATTAGQTVTVNYVGVSYETGEEFDASWEGAEPFSFQLGSGQVIKGWDQGLVGVKVGSRVQLDIPKDLAYPDTTEGPTSGPLRFVVDVLSAE
jgi:peptidylprolyl isomerase